MRRRIVITGGHLTPALAVIEKLQEQGWQIVFFGRKYALEGEQSVSVEYQTIKNLGIPFICLTTGRLQRSLTRYTLISLLKIPLGFVQGFYYLLKYRPAVILSFGGYVALPVALAGWIRRIPVVTHEQSVTPGLATKIIAKFAKKVCVSWLETIGMLKQAQDDGGQKVVLTGNPIREEVFMKEGAKLVHFKDVNVNLPLIYVTGGNLGAHAINEAVASVLSKLLEKHRIIHQCGDSQVYQDYEKLSVVSSQLSVEQRNRYFLTKYVDLGDIGWVLNNADLVISRAGANIVTELAALGKPAILIPLPWAGQNEQMENAKILEKAGTAVILAQEKLTGQSLYHCTVTMIQNLNEYRKHGDRAQKLINLQAAEKLVKIIDESVTL